MSEDIRTIVLYGADGRTLVGKARIQCVGRLPTLIDWDDSPHGHRRFVNDAGVSYRETPSYLLSLGRVGDVEIDEAPPSSPQPSVSDQEKR